MFWKKKQPVTDTVSYESKDRRESYRYDFNKGPGFWIEFKGEKVRVLNISAGGLAFENKGFKQFDFDLIKFTLDIPNYKGDSTFVARLKILEIDKNNICRSIFEQCPIEQHELIHKYVLEMQKNDLAH